MANRTTSRSSQPYFWIFILACALAFWSEWVALFELWGGDAIIYSHGFVVLGALLFVLYLRRTALSTMPLSPSPMGLLALFLCCAAMLLAKSADIITARLFLLPFILVSWGWALWGWRFVRLAGAPIMLLIFAVPIWDDFSPIFQQLTVWVNDALLSLVHIKATISAFYITIPNGTFHVAGGCSGVRYLMSGLFLASLYSILYFSRKKQSIQLILFSALFSIIANWIRVFGIIVVGYQTDMKSSMVHHHEMWGWVVFVVVALIPLFYVARRLEDKQPPVKALASDQPSAAVKPLRTGSITMLTVSILLAGSVPALAYVQDNGLLGGDRQIVLQLPQGSDGWQGPLQHADFWKPSFVNPDISLSGVYVSGQFHKVELYMLGYHDQRQGKELIYYHNRLYSPARWKLVGSQVHSLSGANLFGLKKVRETTLQQKSTGDYVVVWSWYQVDNFAGISPPIIKLVGGLKRLSGKSGGALVAIASECKRPTQNACDAQRQTLKKFADGLLSGKGGRYVSLEPVSRNRGG